MLGIPKHADFHFRPRNMRSLDRTTETFVLLWIVILQTNLELNGLCELAVILFGITNNLADGLSQDITLKLTASENKFIWQRVNIYSTENYCMNSKYDVWKREVFEWKITMINTKNQKSKEHILLKVHPQYNMGAIAALWCVGSSDVYQSKWWWWYRRMESSVFQK